MNPFRYKHVMSGAKVLTVGISYCLSIVVMPSVATDNYTKGAYFSIVGNKLRFLIISRSYRYNENVDVGFA